MTTIYSDPYVLIDVRVVLLAQPFDGEGPHDGTYLLMLYIGLGHTLEQVYITYPTLGERNTAFTNLSRLRCALQEPLPLSMDFGLGGHGESDDEEG